MVLPNPSVYRGPQNTVDSSLAGGTQPGNAVIRLFDDFQRVMSPTETPLTSSIKSGKTINQKKLEWGSSFLARTRSHLVRQSLVVRAPLRWHPVSP